MVPRDSSLTSASKTLALIRGAPYDGTMLADVFQSVVAFGLTSSKSFLRCVVALLFATPLLWRRSASSLIRGVCVVLRLCTLTSWFPACNCAGGLASPADRPWPTPLSKSWATMPCLPPPPFPPPRLWASQPLHRELSIPSGRTK